MFIVNTCWVYVTDSDGVWTLKNVEFAELEKIKAENRAAPKEQSQNKLELTAESFDDIVPGFIWFKTSYIDRLKLTV